MPFYNQHDFSNISFSPEDCRKALQDGRVTMSQYIRLLYGHEDLEGNLTEKYFIDIMKVR